MRGTRQSRLPSLAAIQAFEAAARLGGFEPAGSELGVTASAIGKRITTLEAQLDTMLFVRGRHGGTLTAAGREYLEQVRSALGQLSAATLKARVEPPTELLRVVSTPTFARQVLIPYLPEFTDAHPQVDLEILFSVPYLEISPPNADVWIRFGNGLYPGLQVEKLTDDEVFAVCTPEYARRHGPFERPEDLARAALLRCPMEPWRPWFDRAGLDWPEPSKGVWLVDLGMVLAAAHAGQGVALSRKTLAAEWLNEGKLMRLFDVRSRGNLQYYLCYEQRRPLQNGARAFAARIATVCARIARL
ncbi:LysR substrate-binding domain-containing protein [Bordetella holmesii]|uniref:LysR substrate-binding domain-containing protein n=1 Tax=Bordetella holmesii TaxID=35814 RepID=UPI0012985E1B|nr:LysR substrate-binding domain-containing protein [Bordetella holmesii]QGE30665.1 LysR family transcriptional regulator [Bordetella holmesii]QGE41325.1 LysR family transcriptional regulator [Bordetella holmesii]QGE44574.1 LysR family transcriptional regulator [Bordetella holmesii]QGE47817.1 LysR family transcriptional regulator [Bordetella holmesii]QGE79291.1 LysR family transcriptional regulator [Bordetella holmesii]